MLRSRLGDEAGYSLVELMAAIVILTVAIIPMVTMFDVGLRSAVTSGNYDRARTLANQNLEQVKGMGFSDVQSQNGCPEPASSVFDCELEKNPVRFDSSDNPTGIVQDTSSDPEMMRVTVRVAWDGGSKTFDATGLVVE